MHEGYAIWGKIPRQIVPMHPSRKGLCSLCSSQLALIGIDMASMIWVSFIRA